MVASAGGGPEAAGGVGWEVATAEAARRATGKAKMKGTATPPCVEVTVVAAEVRPEEFASEEEMASVVAGMVAATLEEGVAAVEADAAASCNT